MLAAACVLPRPGSDAGTGADAGDGAGDPSPDNRPEARTPDLLYCDPVTQQGCASGQCEIDPPVGRPACFPQKGTRVLGSRCLGPAQCRPGLQCEDGLCERPCATDQDCVTIMRRCREFGTTTVAGLPLRYCR